MTRKKKRAKPFGGDPMMVTKHSTWGTKAQAKINERMRGYENRIHELETEVARAQGETQIVAHQRDELENKLLRSVVTDKHIAALARLCQLPVQLCQQLDATSDMIVLCALLAQLEGTAPVVTGKEPAPERPFSGISKSSFDQDDDTSIDDLFAKRVDIHLERMDKDYYWLGITSDIGTTVHIDIARGVGGKTGWVRARVRK